MCADDFAVGGAKLRSIMQQPQAAMGHAMLIPYKTDAPIYHYPIGTGVLIAANVLFFIAFGGFDQGMPESWMLRYGDGLHPLEWLTSNFAHAGAMHLIGNMIFLWAFGLIVEGKLGWWRFLLLYLSIGVLQCAVEQILMLGANDGYSLGASGIIYGLLAIAVLWAPRNELSCIWVFFYRGGSVDLTIQTFGLIYLGLQAIELALMEFSMSSAMLHLMGAMAGTAFGLWMLKMRWVDCEGYDLLTVNGWKRDRTGDLVWVDETDPKSHT